MLKASGDHRAQVMMSAAVPGALRVLLVDDEPALRSILGDALAADGHAVTLAADGRDALDRAVAEEHDVVLLDVALGPGPDGVEVCRRLREAGIGVPVLMLTARDSEVDAVLGLESGADDYVTKPFGLAELRSRIRAVLRRSAPQRPERTLLTAVGSRIVVDVALRETRVDGRPVALTFAEFEVLRALAAGPPLRDRQELLRAMWGDDAYRDPRAIDAHVHHLRAKLAAAGLPDAIVTVRGAGYRLRR
jgi:DNA-binding response OmpR family regulator